MTTSVNPVQTRNINILGLYYRLNRFIAEIVKAVSSGTSSTSTFDASRLLSYLTNIRGYVAYVIGEPQMDWPETTPLYWKLEEPPVIPFLENESMHEMALMVEILRDELVASQSSALGAGLLSFDHVRCISTVDRCENMITKFIQVVEPIDLPESSPMRENTGKGLTTVA